MTNGGLDQAEALEQVRWLVTCGMVDMVELSGGSAEQNQKGRLLGELFSLSEVLQLITCQARSPKSPSTRPQPRKSLHGFASRSLLTFQRKSRH